MTYTKKQRNEIYRKALGLFFIQKERRNHYGICVIVNVAAGFTRQYHINDKQIKRVHQAFPELMEFANEDNLEGLWWGILPWDFDSRENALLFMIAMTES
jgi:ABC-type branched-subunit amino acid transport system ATPase component